MDDIGTFLLQLYRLARECGPEAFQGEVLDRLQSGFVFASAFWGAGRIGSSDVVPTWLHTRNVDPSFLPHWARQVRKDPLLPYLMSSPGRALPVHVVHEFATLPELADIAARYRMRAMTVISMPHSVHLPVRQSLEWISLFREQPDAHCTDTEKRWLEAVMPHLTEAWRINRALHATEPPIDHTSALAIAVADAADGELLCADDTFKAALAREWSGFDGHRVPMALRQRWAACSGRFVCMTPERPHRRASRRRNGVPLRTAPGGHPLADATATGNRRTVHAKSVSETDCAALRAVAGDGPQPPRERLRHTRRAQQTGARTAPEGPCHRSLNRLLVTAPPQRLIPRAPSILAARLSNVHSGSSPACAARATCRQSAKSAEPCR